MELAFRLWSGLEGGGPPALQEHRISEAMIGYLDETVDDLFYMSQAALVNVMTPFDKTFTLTLSPSIISD
ncbi:hypothetical protein D3C72_1940480 [compost metagenome]